MSIMARQGRKMLMKFVPCKEEAELSIPQYWPLQSALQRLLVLRDNEKRSRTVQLSRQEQNVVVEVFQIAVS